MSRPLVALSVLVSSPHSTEGEGCLMVPAVIPDEARPVGANWPSHHYPFLKRAIVAGERGPRMGHLLRRHHAGRDDPATILLAPRGAR
jgi:hypothetical protein